MNSSADLFDDTWPHTHGTPDGYDNGCKSSACPAGDDYGMSCKTAKTLSRSDVRYQKLARTGATVAEISETFGLVGTRTAAPTKKPTPKTAKGAPRISDRVTTTPEPDTEQPETVTTTPELDTEQPEVATTAPQPITDDPATHTPAQIRTWAREKGYTVGVKGIIPKNIVEHYWEAHGLLDPTPTPQLPSPIAEHITQLEDTLTSLVPAVDEPEDRPDYGAMNLEHDLTEAIADRDQARDIAARFWDELDRLERTRAEEQAAHAVTRRVDAALLDEARTDITNLTTALTTIKEDRRELRLALAAASGALQTTERALEIVLQKWDDATRKPRFATGGTIHGLTPRPPYVPGAGRGPAFDRLEVIANHVATPTDAAVITQRLHERDQTGGHA